MSETLDIYLRAHTVVLDEPKRPMRGKNRPPGNLVKWPELALVFHCESRTDVSQGLTFGFYRVLRLKGDSYVLEEEGTFFDDELPADEREVLETHVRAAVPDITSFPPRFPLSVSTSAMPWRGSPANGPLEIRMSGHLSYQNIRTATRISTIHGC
jgi:hypothetical protein